MSCRQHMWLALCLCMIFGAIQGQDTRVIVESGSSTTLECPLKSTEEPISWEMVIDGDYIPVATCEPGIPCDDYRSPQYTAQMTSLSGTFISTLQIASARKNETHFACVIGSQISSIYLDVYVYPTKPSCSISFNKQGNNVYADFTCRTDHVYPGFTANVTRTEGVIGKFDYATCHLEAPNSSPTDDYIGICNFRIPGSELLENNTLFIHIYVMVFGEIEVNRPPAVSSGNVLTLGLPRVRIPSTSCPIGPGVTGEYITIGTSATCRCDLIPGVLIPGRVRWYTQDGVVTGTEDSSGRFSMLTVSYNASDAYQKYECRAVNPTAEYYRVYYSPKFMSPAETTTRLSAPIETTSMSSAPTETTTRPSAPAETTTRPSALAETTTRPSAPAETTTRPSAPAETTTRPSAPAETTTRPSAPAETTTIPSAPAETTTRPSAPAETTTRSSAPAETTTRSSTLAETTTRSSAPTGPTIRLSFLMFLCAVIISCVQLSSDT